VLRTSSTPRIANHGIVKMLDYHKKLTVLLVLVTILTGCQGLFGRPIEHLTLAPGADPALNSRLMKGCYPCP